MSTQSDSFNRKTFTVGGAQALQRGRPRPRPELVLLDEGHMEEVCALEQRCYRTPWSSALVRAEFGKDVSYRLGLTIEGELVAYSFSYLIPQDLHILNLAVSPEWRGRGLGRLLLNNILRSSFFLGVRSAMLEVRLSNVPAQRLYASIGFQQIGVRKRYYRDTGEDALVLQATVSSSQLAAYEGAISRATRSVRSRSPLAITHE